MTEATEQMAPPPLGGGKKTPGLRATGGKLKVQKSTKSDAVVRLLSRAKGATIDDMMKATGWQAHSVRGFLAGTLKKKLGRTVSSEKTDKGRVYRISSAEVAE